MLQQAGGKKTTGKQDWMGQKFSLISVLGKWNLTAEIKSHGSKNHVRKLNLRLVRLSGEHMSSLNNF